MKEKSTVYGELKFDRSAMNDIEELRRCLDMAEEIIRRLRGNTIAFVLTEKEVSESADTETERKVRQ